MATHPALPPVETIRAGSAFLGHPRGLAYLAFTEAWERFSFYGMSGLLLMYMLQHLLIPGVMSDVVGLTGLRVVLESVAGPRSDQAFASLVFSLYSGLVYFTPVFGGMLADRLLGQRRVVVIGALLMTAGHLLMAFEAGFLIALLLLITGTGCLKGNISVQVGYLYGEQESGQRTRAFTIFSAAINSGALLGPLVCGILAQVYGWHVGFGTAGALMVIALATYLAGWKHLPPDRRRLRSAVPDAALTDRDWKTISALTGLAAISILPCAAYYQEMNAGLLLIEASVDREVFGWSIPTPSFNAFDGLFCILAVPALLVFWRWQDRRNHASGELAKITIGYLVIAVANLSMVIPAGWADRGETIAMIWPVLLFALNALGFTFYWPTLLALFSRAAPAQVNSTMMGAVFLSAFLGNLLVGLMAGMWESVSHAQFFGLQAVLAFAAFAVMLLVARPMNNLLVPKQTEFQR